MLWILLWKNSGITCTYTWFHIGYSFHEIIPMLKLDKDLAKKGKLQSNISHEQKHSGKH